MSSEDDVTSGEEGSSGDDARDASDGPDASVGDVVEEREERGLSPDVVFDVLKNQRRRYVLRYLTAADGPVVFSNLVDQVAAWENDTTVEALPENDRKRVYLALYQAHLPKMDDAGILDYDQNRGRVTLDRGVLSEFERYATLPWTDPVGRTSSWLPDSDHLVAYGLGAVVALDVAVVTLVPAGLLTTAGVAVMPAVILGLAGVLLRARSGGGR